MVDVLDGLPDDLRQVMAAPPPRDKALVELRLTWPGLADAEARAAARLRVFVLTWDPLHPLERFDPAWATANGDGDNHEIVVYVPLANALDLAAMDQGRVVDVLAALGESAVRVGARHEVLLAAGAYPAAVANGEVAGLLSDPVAELPDAPDLPRFPPPAVALVSLVWEPVGLGAITDAAQDAFGPVDLDRSPVQLSAQRHQASCPACAGQTFGFPADLGEAQATMCPGHAGEAAAVTQERLARAAESNPDGWAAIVQASQAIDRPAPPWDLRRRLRATLDRVDHGWPRPDHPAHAAFVEQLGADADLVVALAADGDGDDGLRDWLSGDWDRDLQLREWLANLLPCLAHAGLTDRVVDVGDALARLDPPEAPGIATDVAQALALAGRRDEAVARVAAVLDAFGGQCWAQLRAGDVFVALDDPATAEDHYRMACAVAAQGGDPSEVSDAYEHLTEFLHDQPGRGADARAARAELAQWDRRHAWISATLTPAATATDTELAPQVPEPAATPAPVRRVKVGRNHPCPCGSGRKHKRCCGAGT